MRLIRRCARRGKAVEDRLTLLNPRCTGALGEHPTGQKYQIAVRSGFGFCSSAPRRRAVGITRARRYIPSWLICVRGPGCSILAAAHVHSPCKNNFGIAVHMDDATYGTGFASFVEQLPAGSANKTTSTPQHRCSGGRQDLLQLEGRPWAGGHDLPGMTNENFTILDE